MKYLSPILISCCLFACSPNGNKEPVTSISSELSSKELATSIVKLRGAVKASPQDANQRYLLAKAYLYQGKYDFAEKEVNKYLENIAEENSSSVDRIVMEILFLSESYTSIELLADKLAPGSASHNTAQDLLSLSGQRPQNQVKSELFKKLYPLLNQNKLNELGAFLDENTISQHTFIQQLLAARFYYSIGDFKSSSIIFEQLHLLRPYDAQAIVLAAISFYKANLLEKADYYADLLLKANKDNPIAMLIKGSINFEAGNFATAEQELELATSRGLDSFEVRLTSALTSYQLGNFEKAYNHFQRIESKIPETHPIYRYITATKLMLGDPLEAYQSSKGMEVNDSTLPLLLNLARSLRATGETKESDLLLSQLKKEQFSDKDINYTLDSYLKSVGQIDSASLTSSFDDSSQNTQQRAVLIVSLLSSKEEQTAIEYLDKWLTEAPSDEKLLILKLAALVKVGDPEKIKETIENLEEVSPKHPLLNSYKALALLQNGDKAKAHQLLEETISNNFYSPWAVKLLVNSSNDDSELNGTLKFLVSVYDDNEGQKYLEPTLDLAFTQASANQFESAIATIDKWEQAKSDTTPESVEIFQLKTVLYLSIKELDDARETLAQWKSSLGISKEYLLRALSLADLDKDWRFATLSINEAQNKLDKENSETLKLLKVKYLLKDNQNAEAIKSLDSCSFNTKAMPIWKKLKGQTLAVDKKHSQALAFFSDAYRMSNSTELAIFLMQSYYANGQPSLAEKFALKHLGDYPKDVVVRMRLAELLFNSSPRKAIKHYEFLNDNGLASTSSLNNHAWLLLKVGENKSALEFAEKAYKKSPSEIAVIDTYIKSLVANNKIGEALELAESLYSKQRDNFKIAMIYTKTLLDSNDKNTAKGVLRLITPKNGQQRADYDRMKGMLSDI